MAIPNMIDVGIPDNGIEIDDDIKEAKLKPALAVIADKATPGSIAGDDEGVCCLAEVENEDDDPRIFPRAHSDVKYTRDGSAALTTTLSSSLQLILLEMVVGSKHDDSLICGWKNV